MICYCVAALWAPAGLQFSAMARHRRLPPRPEAVDRSARACSLPCPLSNLVVDQGPSGFAARDWSDTLNLESLTALPASYVGHDLRQRHGDLVWRVRFRDEQWLYLVLLLEFQSNVDRSMAVRMLTYTGLLHQRLIDEGVLREHGALPPVLPIVIYNGRRSWTAPTDVTDLLGVTDETLARYQPSQRYFLLDEGSTRAADLPGGNLVSALVALETTRERAQIERHLRTLIDLLRGQEDDELRRAFSAWARQALMPAGFRPNEAEPLAQLEEVRTMLAETVREWTKDWVAQGREEGREEGLEKGREEGREEGRAEERSLLCRLAARKFDADAAGQLADALAGVDDPARLARVGEWIIECETAADLLAHVLDTEDGTG